MKRRHLVDHASKSSRNRIQKRRMLSESLEPRLMLAADPAEDVTAVTVSTAESSSSDPLRIATQGEGEAAASLQSGFGQQLRSAITEISRVVETIGQSPAFDHPIPFLGQPAAVDVGGTSVIDTETIGSLFNLAGRFEDEIAFPLRNFLDLHPTATAAQLVSQFSFLETVPGLSAGTQGVRLNFDAADTYQSSLAALFEPLTSNDGGLIDAVDGDAIATELPFDVSFDGLSIEVLERNGTVAVLIPEFSLDLSQTLDSIDFAANVGFLSGRVSDGSIDLDLQLDLAFGDLFLDTMRVDGPFAGRVSLDALSGLSAGDIAGSVGLDVGGDGLELEFPFQFELNGFDTAGYESVFRLTDDQPVDGVYPPFELSVPATAPYTADSILGFHNVSATSILSSLEQLGGVFGSWESGSLLELPLPLGENVAIGDVIGFAETFDSRVLQSLRGSDGLPTFTSIQELGDLVPALNNAVGDAISSDSISYDAETQQLDLSLDLFRSLDPFDVSANLEVLEGLSNSPFTSVQTPPGDTMDENRLRINRDTSLGFDLSIDLSSGQQAVASTNSPRNVAVDAGFNPGNVHLWTSIGEILRRKGLDVGRNASSEIRLRSGDVVTMNLGRLDDSRTLGDVLQASRVDDGTQVVAELTFEDGFLGLVDHTTDGGSELAVLHSSGGFFALLNDVAESGSNTILGDYLPFPRSDDPEFINPSYHDGLGLLRFETVTVQLSNGQSVSVGDTLGEYEFSTVEDVLDAFTVSIGGEPALAATYSQGRITLHDLTEPNGDSTFAVTWLDSGDNSASLARVIGLGEDDDNDQKIVGPQFIPSLPVGNNPPVNGSSTLGHVLPRLGLRRFIDTDHHELHVIVVDRENVLLGEAFIETGPLTSELSLEQLADRMNAQATLPSTVDFSVSLVEDRFDFHFPGGHKLYLFSDSPFLASLLGDATTIGLDRILFSDTVSTRSFAVSGVSGLQKVVDLVPSARNSVAVLSDTTPLSDILTDSSFNRYWGTTQAVTVFIADSELGVTEFEISTGELTRELTVGELADRLTYFVSGELRLRVSYEGGRLVLRTGTPETVSEISALHADPFFELLFQGQFIDDGPFPLASGNDGYLATAMLTGLNRSAEVSQPIATTTTTLQEAFANTDLERFLGTTQALPFSLESSTSTVETIQSTGVLEPSLTLGELAERLTFQSGNGAGPLMRVGFESGQFRFVNEREGDQLTISVPRDNEFFTTLLGGYGDPEFRIKSIDESMRSEPLHLLYSGPDESVGGETFAVTLLNGLTLTIDTGLIHSQTTLDQLTDRLTVHGALGPLSASPYRAGIRLEDYTSPIAFDSATAIDPQDSLLARRLFGDAQSQLSGVIQSNDLIDPLTVFQPEVFIRPATEVPPWTPMTTIVERMGTALDQAIIDVFRVAEVQVELQDGTETTLSLNALTSMLSVQDFADGGKVFRDGEMILEMAFVEDRFEIRDLSTGAPLAPLELNYVEGSEIFEMLFGGVDTVFFGVDTGQLDRLVSRPLGETTLEAHQGRADLNKYLSRSDARVGADAAALRMTMRDGTEKIIRLGDAVVETTLDLLEQLTVIKDGEVVVRAWIEDGAVHVQDNRPANDDFPFEINWLGEPNGSYWPAEFVPIGQDHDGDGRLVGPTFVPQLPGATPPINGQTLVEDVLRRRTITEELDLVSEATVLLRDGVSRTISTGEITRDLTLDALIERWKIVENGELVLDARVENNEILLEDLSAVDNGARFELSDPHLLTADFGGLFAKLGLIQSFAQVDSGSVSGDVDDDRIIRSDSLSGSLINPLTRLAEIFGSEHPFYDKPVDQTTWEIAPGQRVTVTAGPFNGGTRIADVLDDLTVRDADQNVLIAATLQDNRIVLSNGAAPMPGYSGMKLHLEADEGYPSYWAFFFAAERDFDVDGALPGRPLVPDLPDFRVDDTTTLGGFAKARGLERLLDQVDTPLIAELRDGTRVDFEVRAYDSLTLDDYLSQFRIKNEDGEVVMEAQIQRRLDAVGDIQRNFVLHDFTSPGGGEATFSVRVDPQADRERITLLPVFMGLAGVDESGAGRIVGPDLSPKSIDERVRINLTEPLTLRSEIAGLVENVNAEVRIGELLSAGITDGNGQVSAVVELSLTPPAGQDYLSLSDLVGALANPSERVQADINASVNFTANVGADLAGLNVTPDDPNQTPTISVDWPDAVSSDPSLHFQTDTLSVTTSNFDNLLTFDGLRVEHITELVRRLVDLIDQISGGDALSQQIPLVNTSLGEVLDTVDYVNGIVERMVADPNSTLQTLEEDLEATLGLEPDELTLSYDPLNSALRADFDLTLADVTRNVNFALDLGEVVPELAGLVDFSQKGSLEIVAGADVHLHVGLSLPDLQDNFENAFLVYDTTGVSATALVDTEDVTFDATVLGLGASVGPLTAQLKRDGVPLSSDQRALFEVGLTPSPNGVRVHTDLQASVFASRLDAQAFVQSDISIAGRTTGFDAYLRDHEAIHTIEVLPAGSSIDFDGGNQAVLPDVQDLLDGYDVSDAIYALAVGLEGLFDLIDEHLGEQVLGIPVPLIGMALSDAVDFTERFRNQLRDGLSADGLVAETARTVVYDVLGPGADGGGLNVLGDRDGDGSITPLDVGLESTDDEIAFQILIADRVQLVSGDVGLDVGVPALGFELDGQADLSYHYSFEIGFGVGRDVGPFIDLIDGDEISLGVEASVGTLLGGASLGPLGVRVSKIDASALSPTQRQRTRLDPDDPESETINGLRGEFRIDLGGGSDVSQNRVPLNQLIGPTGLDIQASAAIVGSLFVQVETEIDGADGLPSLQADVNIVWDRIDEELSSLIDSFDTPGITLTNVGLDLGSFVNDVLKPVLDPINDFLDPIRPVLDAVTTPLPVLSDLAGTDVAFTDLIGLFGQGGETIGEFIEATATIARLIDIPQNGFGEFILPLGNFETEYGDDGSLSPTTSSGAFGGFDSFDDYVSAQPDTPLKDYLESVPRDPTVTADTTVTPGRFSIPAWDDPSSLVQLLFGRQDVDLVKYQAPRLESTFSYSQYIPIWPIFGVTIGGSFGIAVDLAFGYDTQGLFDYAASGEEIDLLNGIYFDDRLIHDPNTGELIDDVNELEFSLGIMVGGELNLLLVSAGAVGNLTATIGLDLNDPNEDGKIRLDEFTENLEKGFHPLLGPIWLFDASGKLTVGAAVYVEAVGFRGQIDVGPFTLLDFDIPLPEPAQPILGEKVGNELIINVGDRAILREVGDVSDGDEEILIGFDEETNEIVVAGFGRDQRFSGINRITLDAGAGDDKIIVGPEVTIPVTMHGGIGDDFLQAGGGAAMMFGNSGHDIIVGSPADDTIFGGTGEDQLDGKAGDDVIRGGENDDQLRGGVGSDRLHGDDGDDNLTGGDGSDFLYGGDGDDVISGQAGDDLLLGESEDGSGQGEDFLQGGTGYDRLEGGPLSDELYGGAGPDDLFGGGGNDFLVGGSATRYSPLFSQVQPSLDESSHTLEGGDDDDFIYGTAGVDTVNDLDGHNRVFTYEGNDVITLGSGDDVVFSHEGEDVIDAGNGFNSVRSGADFDIVTTGLDDDFIDLRGGFIGDGVTFGSIVRDAGGVNRVLGDEGDDDIAIEGTGQNVIFAGDGENTIVTGSGADLITSGSGRDVIDAGNGENEIASGGGDDDVRTGRDRDYIDSGAGDDTVHAGAGDDNVQSRGGNDVVDTASGNDVIDSGDGNDYVVAGRGDDAVSAGNGSDIVWAGLEGPTAEEIRSALITAPEFAIYGAYDVFFPPAILPAVLEGLSFIGEFDEGADVVNAGGGDDFVFGGGGDDDLDGDLGDDYIDGGAGQDIVQGGGGADYARGGAGDDTVRGGSGIDILLGDNGGDDLRGDAGDGAQQHGQMLFGGPGNDSLFGYAPNDNNAQQSLLIGDRLDGGDGIDELLGSLRREFMDGGRGDDRLEGDRLRGEYRPNTTNEIDPFVTGGADTMFGGNGDDVLLGGGGADEMWGGAGTDSLEGHAGADIIRGGTGIDFIYLDLNPNYPAGSIGGQFDGFYGNAAPNDVNDDDATDILVAVGTPGDDILRLGGNAAGQLTVFFNDVNSLVDFRNEDGEPAIQQFKINGLAGNDELAFLPSLDLGEFEQRSRDWVGEFNGGSGNDTLIGSDGRDWLNGGPGNDRVFGNGGDDRLRGDDLDGSEGDFDRLYAGPGNDDLLGGLGTNWLYAWSDDPSQGTQWGRFVDVTSGETFDSPGPKRELEDTGLNRMLGRDGDDRLYAGTGLDFMYGGAGEDTLYDVDGVELAISIGVPETEEWLEYARSTNKIWYYGGSGSDDVITVDYVTEPGVLGDHHLITRLTENNGLFTFDAQVQLDFAAVDAAGQRIWDPEDLLYQLQELDQADGDDARQLIQQRIELSGGLLPPEGDYMAIVIDAKAGDDEIRVGPTVQRTVWISGGEGDDIVQMESGTPLLPDLADADNRNEVPGDPSDASSAFDVNALVSGDVDAADAGLNETVLLSNLTLDSPTDVDWYRFRFDNDTDELFITVDSVADTDQMIFELYESNVDGNLDELDGSQSGSLVPPIDPRKPSRVEFRLSSGANAGTEYFVRVRSNAEIPTLYDLGIDIGNGQPLGDSTFDMSVSSDVFLRRDVIVGGEGNDVLQGGPSEDWVIGGPGNDVLSGGFDRGASDIIIGEAGDDLIQILLDDMPTGAGGGTQQLTLSDEIEGSEGYDRILIQGGDVDRFGDPIPDHLTLSHSTLEGTSTLAGLVWDTANQRFLKDGDRFVIQQARYTARQVEGTLFDLRGGDDELHLEDGYSFPGSDQDNDPVYGIGPAHRQNGAASLNFEVRGGAGNDRIFGSPYGDVIDAGGGIDFVAGLGGDDTIRGGSEDDVLVGNGFDVVPIDRLETTARNEIAVRNDAAFFATPLDLSSGMVEGLTLHQGDTIDWYVLPLPTTGSLNSDKQIRIAFETEDPPFGDIAGDVFGSDAWIDPLVTLTPAVRDVVGGGVLPVLNSEDANAFLVGVENPRSRAIIARRPAQFGSLTSPTGLSLGLDIENASAIDFGITVDSETSGLAAATALNAELQFWGLDAEVTAEYDPREDRLMMVLRRRGSLQLLGNESSWATLGFDLDQVVGEQPTALGTYSITAVDVTFEPDADAEQEPRPYRMEMGAVDLDFQAPRSAPTLAMPNPPTSSGVMRIEGNEINGKLGFAQVVGDINGDAVADVMISGQDQAFVIYGPITTTLDAVSVTDLPHSTIDVSSADGPSWTPIEGGRDLDGDGRNDLAFYRSRELSAPGNPVDYSVEVSVLSGEKLETGSVSVDSDGVIVVDLAADRSVPVNQLDVQWLEYDSALGADLMVFARQPIFDRSGVMAHGGVFAGVSIADSLSGFQEALGAFAAQSWVLDGIQPDSIVDLSVPADFTVVSNVPAFYRQQLQATKIDADGDGQDEIALTRPHGWVYQHDQNPSEYLVIGRTYILDLEGASGSINTGDVDAQARVQLEAPVAFPGAFSVANLVSPFNQARGTMATDFDFDGVDELIAVSGGATPDVLVFSGLGVRNTLRSISGATLRLDNVSSNLANLQGLGIGDFDGDGEIDLVVSTSSEGSLVGETRIIFDPMSTNAQVINANDGTLQSERYTSMQPGDGMGVVAGLGGDFNDDGIDDLLIGAPSFDTVATGIERNAGAVFLLPGQIRPDALFKTDGAILLENESIRGVGGALLDRGSNERFDGATASNPDDYVLVDGSDSRLFKFRFLGDAQPGDMIRLGPALSDQPFLIDLGTTGHIETFDDNRAMVDVDPILVGGVDPDPIKHFGLFQMDLGKLLLALADPDVLIGAEFRLHARTTVPMNVRVEFVQVHKPSDGSAMESDLGTRPALFESEALSVPDGDLLTVDIAAAAGGIEPLRDFIRGGTRHLVARIRAIAPGSIEFDRPQAGDQPATGLLLYQRPSVLGTVRDAEGRILGDNASAYDLRNFDAGTYFLQVRRSAPNVLGAPIPFDITINAPALTDFDRLTDNDDVRGGDGDDILSGGPGLDKLLGESGNDGFVAESYETLDRTEDERIREPISSDALGLFDSRLIDDPIVWASKLSNVERTRGIVEVVSPILAEAIGDAVGVELVPRADGSFEFAKPLHASDLGGVRSLDLSRTGIDDLSGMEVLTSLASLDLSRTGIRSIEMDALFGGDGGITGTNNLQHLNLDFGVISRLSDIATLSRLEVLSLSRVAGGEGGGDLNLSELSPLSLLKYLDVSDNFLNGLNGLADQYTIDDSDYQLPTPFTVSTQFVVDNHWTMVASDTTSSYQGTYSFLDATVAPSTSVAAWEIDNVPAGQYEVLATWQASEANASSVIYTVHDNSAFKVYQRVAPFGVDIDGHSFESIGTIHLSDVETVRVELGVNSLDGLVMADGILIRPLIHPFDDLRNVAVGHNRLGGGSYTLITESLADATDALVWPDPSTGPRWVDLPTAGVTQAIEGKIIELPDIFSNLVVSNSDTPILQIRTDNENIRVRQRVSSGISRVEISQLNPTVEDATLRFIATERITGLTTTHVMHVGFGGSIVEGTVADSVTNAGIAGAHVFVDANRDGQAGGAEPQSTTDLDGRYSLFVPPTSLPGGATTAEVVLESTEGQFRVLPIGGAQEVTLPAFPDVIGDTGFVVISAATLNAPSFVEEGEVITATLESTQTLSSIDWSINGVSQGIETATAMLSIEQGGIYELVAMFSINSTDYTLRRTLRVVDVAPRAAALDDVTTPEGRFQSTQTVIVDSGGDTWDVTINYGDGTNPVELLGLTERSVTFDHIYKSTGSYNVSYTVSNDEGESSGNFDLSVVEAGVDLAITPTGGETSGAKGNEILWRAPWTDHSGQANPFEWTFEVAWGDDVDDLGNPIFVDVTDQLTVLPDGGAAKLLHSYATEGTYEVIFRIHDDDNALYTSVPFEIIITNDAPTIDATIPTNVDEKTLIDFSASVIDLDGFASITWDFGDGSVIRTGEAVEHLFAAPGTYTVVVTATDTQGLTSTASGKVNVANIDESPAIKSIDVITIQEAQPWQHQVDVVDPDTIDAGDTLRYSLVDAPAGMSIDGSGLITWTPTVNQGPQTYSFGVTAVDGTDRPASTTIRVRVVDSGSIQGLLFEDTNGNGRHEIDEPLLTGIVVDLDAGNDGQIDQTSTTGSDGRYAFDALPRGLYGIQANLNPAWEWTTPSELIFDMAVSEAIVANSLGGRADSDGDGIPNEQELNLPTSGDGNADGIPDWRQGNVASLEMPGGIITIVSQIGTTLAGITSVDPIATSPDEAILPFGRINFDITGLPLGGRAEVEVIVGSGTRINAVFQVDDDANADDVFRLLGQSDGETVTAKSDSLLIETRDGAEADLDSIADGTMRFSLQPAGVDAVWTNPALPTDVDGNGSTTPIDALLIINALKQAESGAIDLVGSRPPGADYLDASGDGKVTVFDALLVINQLKLDVEVTQTESRAESLTIGLSVSSANSGADDEHEDPIETSRLF